MGRSDLNSGRDPDGERRRLIVDVSVISRQDAGTGIQRVVRNVWTELCSYSRDWDIIPVSVGTNGKFFKLPSNFLARPETGDIDPNFVFDARANDVFLGLDFSPIRLLHARPTIARWKQLGVSIHLVVYDLLPVTKPAWFTRRGRQNYRKWFHFMQRYADKALCISETVAVDLRARLKRRTWRNFWHRSRPIGVDVIRLGTQFRLSAGKALRPKELGAHSGRSLILMVGTVEPRKGYDFALRVFDQLWSRSSVSPLVVIVGKAGWKTRRLQTRLKAHPQVGASLLWLSGLEDGGLAWLYANSTVFFSASQAEGFGLPLVEAMSYNLPVVATDLPVFRELDRSNILFFEKNNIEEAAELLLQVIESRPVSENPLQNASVSWADTARDIFKQVTR